jgi:ADP-ribose pyrophosphatase YjhB (NUDIX family)
MTEPEDTSNGANVIIWTPRTEILLVRHDYGNKNWALPGGALRVGETAVNAAVRETVEETGFKPLPELKPVAIMSQRTLVSGELCHGLCSIYSTQRYSGHLVCPEGEISDARFVSLQEIFHSNGLVGLGYKRMIAVWFNNLHSFTLYEGSLADPVKVYIDEVLVV